MTTEVFRIPLTSLPQRFSINIGGAALIMVSRYNNQSVNWVLDFYDGNTSDPLVLNMPMVTGVDLFEQYRFLQLFDGKLIVYTDGDDFAVPTEDNLGQEANLFYVVDQ